MKISKTDHSAAVATLRDLLAPGATVYTILRHVSASGMTRRISVVVIDKEGRPFQCDYLAARVMGYNVHRDGGLIVTGCGMDMGFHVVYSLSRRLFADGFGIVGQSSTGRKVRAKDAKHAARLVKAGAIFRGRNGDTSGWDTDGGYALNQRWL